MSGLNVPSPVRFPSVSYVNVANVKTQAARKDYAIEIGSRCTAFDAILRARGILGDATDSQRALRLRPEH